MASTLAAAHEQGQVVLVLLREVQLQDRVQPVERAAKIATIIGVEPRQVHLGQRL